MIRILDLFFSSLGFLILSPVFIIIFIIGLFDTGSPLFMQPRVGLHKKMFYLLKFRTMHKSTKSVASHLANSHDITRLGKLLRKSKLDELPQLINVIMGDMSLVGPRPNLFNQEELIAEREKYGVYNVLPGITGAAQINKIDMSTPELLAKTDAIMLQNFTIKNYFYYIFVTILGKGSGDGIKKN